MIYIGILWYKAAKIREFVNIGERLNIDIWKS